MVVKSAGKTDVGIVRKSNEDCIKILPEKNLFIVCDGMGGHNAGEVVFDSRRGILKGLGSTTLYSPQFSPNNRVWYRQRVRAFDGIGFSAWMPAARFYLDTLYESSQPPQPPVLVSPGQFDTLISLQVSLVAAPAYDPEQIR